MEAKTSAPLALRREALFPPSYTSCPKKTVLSERKGGQIFTDKEIRRKDVFLCVAKPVKKSHLGRLGIDLRFLLVLMISRSWNHSAAKCKNID